MVTLKITKYIVTWALGHLATNATPEQYDKNLKEWRLEDLPIIPKIYENGCYW